MHKNFFGNALIGACTAVLLSIPLAAQCAFWAGDNYNTRVIIYSIFLLWIICGAVSIFLRTFKNEKSKFSIKFVLLWFLSVWLWPLLLLCGTKRN